jgi:predicted permease
LFTRVLRGRAFEDELDEELRIHMEMQRADLIARGRTAEEAEREVRRSFGVVSSVKEECREAAPLAWMHALGRDIRYGFRLLRRSPGFALASILTLALCVGANTAVFSIVDAAFFRALPYPDPSRLGQIETRLSNGGDESIEAVDGATGESLRDRTPDIDTAVAAGWTGGANLVVDGRAEYVTQHRVSAGYWRVLGVQPFMGREFTREEDVPGGRSVAVLSYELWQRVCQGRSDAIGHEVTLRGETYQIVGVLSKGLRPIVEADIWTPLQPSTEGEGSGENYTVLARLGEGVSWPAAEVEVRATGNEVLKDRDGGARQLRIVPLRQAVYGELHQPLMVMWAGVGVVMLIGCVNLAGLLLARASIRSREIATRMAIGGGRVPIVRQLVAEGLAIVICGGAAGLGIGFVLLRVLGALSAGAFLLPVEAGLDPRVLLCAAGLSFVTCIAFATYPAILLSRTDVASVLDQSGARVAQSRRRHGARRALVVAQIALAVVLLACAGLLVRSFSFLEGIDSGVASKGLVTATVSLDDVRYRDSESITRLFSETTRSIESKPGIEGAGVALTLPYQRPLNIGFRVAGESEGDGQTMNLIYATPGYLDVLGADVVSGRALSGRDVAGAPRAVVVSEAFVRRYLDGLSPLALRLTFAGDDWEIVGVVGNVVQKSSFGNFGPVAPMPSVYVTPAQMPDELVALVHGWFAPSWVVRSRGTANAAVEIIRQEIARFDPTLPLASVRTIDDLSRETLARERFEAQLMAATAGLALFLAAIGLAGLVASSVEEQRRELGVRMALGATRWDAVRTAISPGLVLTAVGLVLGGLLVIPATRALRGLIWGISPTDGVALAGVVVILAMVAVAASVIPAIRIARLDPVRALRDG